MTTPPPGQYPPGQPVPPYGAPVHPQPVYGQPVFHAAPVVYPQAYQEPEPPPQPQGGGASAMRGVLILAAVAGVITVIIGVFFILGSPDEYAPPARQTLKIKGAEGLVPSVGPGGTGQPLTQAVATAPPPAPTLPPAAAMQPSSPRRLIVPRLGINAPIKSVGTDKSGAIETPPISNHNLVGWYRGGPTAGEPGPAVMLGHKDTTTRSAVFTRLHEIQYGDTIEVVRMDGTVAVFTVGGVEQANKQTFPTDRVYGSRENAELRLITCGGSYNRNTGHYVDNVIVYATMTSTRLASD
ncbi:class F sortase [Microtetraspora glauca]|uniref:Class F sortase n=1 Tax=Microtetraspora glauca TaxID=1996 RepID=A0ABV3G634_MICGL